MSINKGKTLFDIVLAVIAIGFFLNFCVVAAKPILTKYSGSVAPVTINTEIHSVAYAEEGAYVSLSFEKVRACTFKNLYWQDKDGYDIRINFNPKYPDDVAFKLDRSRPTGKQKIKEWLLLEVTDVSKTNAVVEHDCYGLWSTYTKFYPSIHMHSEGDNSHVTTSVVTPK